MDGARAEKTASRALVTRLRGRSSPWTVAELFLLGDGAVADLEELARGTFESTVERRVLGARILAAIGTPLARAALRRVVAACAASAGEAPMADLAVAREVASHLGDRRGQLRSPAFRAIGTMETRGSDRAA